MEEETSTLNLILEKGPRKGETLEFRPRQAIRIGRVVRGNTVVIKDGGISSNHLSIEFQSGKWLIKDLDSSNGTMLNGSKLPPLRTVDVSDGDTIKIGEFTCIKLRIEVTDGGEDNRPRKNPRRRGGLKENLVPIDEACELGLCEDAGNKNQKRPRGRPKKGKATNIAPEESLNEIEKVEILYNVGPTDGKQGQQVSTRRTRSSKKEENSSSKEIRNQGVDIAAQLVDKKTRGGTRRKKDLWELNLGQEDSDQADKILVKSQPVESLREVKIVRKVENLRQIETNQGTQVSIRRTRSSKMEETSSSTVHQNEEVNVAAQTGDKRGRRRRKKNSNPNLGKEDYNTINENSTKVQSRGFGGGSNSEKITVKSEPLESFCEVGNVGNLQHLGPTEAKQGDKMSTRRTTLRSQKEENLGLVANSSHEPSTSAQDADKMQRGETTRKMNLQDEQPLEKEREDFNGSNLGQEEFTKESGIEGGEAPDLEKMTLKEWFDYLEVYLPKLIYEETEKMILGMNQKAEQCHEFVLKHKKDKEKGQ